MPRLDPRTTCLVLIDLQKGILSLPAAPRSGQAVAAAGIALAARFRAVGSPVVLVNISWSADMADVLRQPVDKPRPLAPPPEGWSDLVDGLAQPGDIRITKRQWGAFYGTDLDLQLRRRGLQTIVLGGVSTNIGVESTARQAWEHGYALVLAEDAMASTTAEMHAFSITEIMPRIGRVVQAGDITLSQD